MEEKILFKENDGYIKIFNGMGMKLYNNLSYSEIATFVLMLDHICYDDCKLRKNGNKRGRLLDIKNFSEITKVSYNTIRKPIYALRNKKVIYIDNNGSITINPYIVCKGNLLSPDTINYFNDSIWNNNIQYTSYPHEDLYQYLRNQVNNWKKDSIDFCDQLCVISGG